MNSKLKTIVCVLLFVPAYLLLYTLLHEGGHALVILACGGTIDSFVLGLNAHVSAHGAEFTVFSAALNHAAGMLLPTMIGVAAICFYDPKIKFAAYHLCYLAGSVSLVSSILFVWVTFPAISLFTALPQGEDVTKFLNVTGFPPLLVSLGALLLAAMFVLLMYKKGMLGKAGEGLTSIRGSGKISRRNSLMIAVLALIAAGIMVAPHVMPAPAVFSASFHSRNVLEEKGWECAFNIEETKSYAIDLKMKAQGFITALRILDENGELSYQNLGEAFSFTTRMELSKGRYTLSLTYLMENEAVGVFWESTGQEEMRDEDRAYITEVFSHSKDDYSAVFSIQIR